MLWNNVTGILIEQHICADVAVVGLWHEARVAEWFTVEGDRLQHLSCIQRRCLPLHLFQLIVNGVTKALNIGLMKSWSRQAGENVILNDIKSKLL